MLENDLDFGIKKYLNIMRFLTNLDGQPANLEVRLTHSAQQHLPEINLPSVPKPSPADPSLTDAIERNARTLPVNLTSPCRKNLKISWGG